MYKRKVADFHIHGTETNIMKKTKIQFYKINLSTEQFNFNFFVYHNFRLLTLER